MTNEKASAGIASAIAIDAYIKSDAESRSVIRGMVMVICSGTAGPKEMEAAAINIQELLEFQHDQNR